MARAAQILSQLLDADDDDDLDSVGAHRDELASLLPLLGLECFDRRALHHALAARTLAPREARA